MSKTDDDFVFTWEVEAVNALVACADLRTAWEKAEPHERALFADNVEVLKQLRNSRAILADIVADLEGGQVSSVT